MNYIGFNLGYLYYIKTSLGYKWAAVFGKIDENIVLFVGHSANAEIPKGESLIIRRSPAEVAKAKRREYRNTGEFSRTHKEYFRRIDRKK